MKTKVTIAIIAIITIAGIFALLFRNKANNQEKMKKAEINTASVVSVANVTKESIESILSATGTLFANREATIASETQGRIVEMKVDIGSYITAGSLIARVDDELKKAALATAEANYEKAKADYDRYTKLLKEKSGTDAQFESARFAFKTADAQLITAKRQFNDTKITAPFSGFVTQKMVDLGSTLNSQTNTQIISLVDISSLKLRVNLAEKDAFQIKIGESVKIQTSVYPGSDFEGKIKSISAKADEAKTFLVEIEIKNEKNKMLRAGMFAKAEFSSQKRNENLTIPRTALVGSAKDPKVYVVENSCVKLKSVSIAEELSDKLIVGSGLNEGEVVVTTGQINLHDGDQITIKQ